MGWLNRDGVIGVDRVGMMGWREEERMRRWERKRGVMDGGEGRNETKRSPKAKSARVDDSNIQQAESHIHHESRNIYATIPFLSLRLKLNASHLWRSETICGN